MNLLFVLSSFLLLSCLTLALNHASLDEKLHGYPHADCHRCGQALQIDHIFQIDGKLFVQLKGKHLANKNMTYQVIDLHTSHHSLVRSVDLFGGDLIKVISVLDFGSLNQTCEQPNSCSTSQVRSLRDRILAVGHSMSGEIRLMAFHKLYTDGILVLNPLSPVTTATVSKLSGMSQISLRGIRSIVMLQSVGLLVVTYRQDNITLVQSLNNHLLLRQSVRIERVLPSDLASGGMFVWRGQLYLLDHKDGVFSSVPVSSLLQQLLNNGKSSGLFQRLSVHHFFKCDCTSDSKSDIQLIGVNDRFAMYREMDMLGQALVQSERSDQASLQELIHNLKLSFYSQLYAQIVPASNATHPLAMVHLQACLARMLANESSRSDHYHHVQLGSSMLFSETGFQVEGHPRSAVRPNRSNLLNLTELCAPYRDDPSNWWLVVCLLLYLLLGMILFCLMLGCCSCEGTYTRKEELYLITELATRLASQVNCNAMIQLEDFNYLLLPYQAHHKQNRQSLNVSAGFSINTTASKQTERMAMTKLSLKPNEMCKSIRSNPEPVNLMAFGGPSNEKANISPTEFDFATSVDMGEDANYKNATIHKKENNRVNSGKLLEKISTFKVKENKTKTPLKITTMKCAELKSAKWKAKGKEQRSKRNSNSR